MLRRSNINCSAIKCEALCRLVEAVAQRHVSDCRAHFDGTNVISERINRDRFVVQIVERLLYGLITVRNLIGRRCLTACYDFGADRLKLRTNPGKALVCTRVN